MADNSSRLDAGSSVESIASDDIGGVKYQRVKIGIGPDGTAVDLREPLDGMTTGIAAVGGMVWNGSSWEKPQSSDALLDGDDGVGVPTSQPMLYNGATYDKQRGNTTGTLLASAARTAQTSSATQTNYNARGVIVLLTVTAASGTGGLSVIIQALFNGLGVNLNANPTPVTATGTYGYEFYPGASTTPPGSSGSIVQRTAAVLPRSWVTTVGVGNSSSYTYQVDYQLIL